MQVISEERGFSLDKVQIDMLGTAKKVCATVFVCLCAILK